MTGPSPGSLAGTCALVLVPSAVFNALVVPDVASKYSLAFTVVAIAWPLWCLSCLVAAGTTDPGIVRREPYRPPPEGRARARYKEERLPNGKSVTVKWNDTCNLYQPPRAHHCSVNDDCIDKFDHHCPWVGTTIGRRNYRPFLGFVFGTAILCVFVIATCALQIKIKYDELPADAQSRNLKAMGKAPAAMIVLFVSFLGFCFVGVLSCFHAYLVATNQTTYENFRDGYSWDENPYNKGLIGNCLEAWCARAPPSRFRFRKPASQQPHLDGIDLAKVIDGKLKHRPPMGFWHNHTVGQSTWNDRLIKQLLEAQQAGAPNPLPQRLLKNVNEFPKFTRGDYNGHAAWTDWPWKFHRIQKKGKVTTELYNLVKDPMETTDLANKDTSRATRMQKALEQWQSSVYDSWEGRDYAKK